MSTKDSEYVFFSSCLIIFPVGVIMVSPQQIRSKEEMI